MTFTCIGDDHSGVVTLLSENNDDHNNKNNNKQRGSTSKRTGVFHSWRLGREPHRQSHGFDLTVFNPPTPQRCGKKHIGLSAREVLPKVADPQSFLPFTGLSRSYVETMRGKIWKKKKEMFMFVSLLCHLHFWSLEFVDLTSTAVVIYIVL